jgi:hypothetical protein
MFAEERLRAEDGGVDFALVGSNWGAEWGASGLHAWCSARTCVDSLTACGPSQEPVRSARDVPPMRRSRRRYSPMEAC